MADFNKRRLLLLLLLLGRRKRKCQAKLRSLWVRDIFTCRSSIGEFFILRFKKCEWLITIVTTSISI